MQVLCPFLLDQFYWAERLHWLGVAPEPLQRQHLIPDNDDALSIHNAADVLLGAIRSVLLPEIKDQATIIANRLSFEVSCVNGAPHNHCINYQGYSHVGQHLFCIK